MRSSKTNDRDLDLAILTVIRKSSAPYLPPPLLRFLHVTDAYFHRHHESLINDYCSDEPSMAILSALFLAYIVCRSIQGMWASTTTRSTAHLAGHEDTVLGGLAKAKVGRGVSKQRGNQDSGGYDPPPFRETVVLCGASNSGKTALLHYLCHGMEKENAWDPPMTVTSLSANVGYVCPWEGTHEDDKSGADAIRIIDYPGHPSLSSELTSMLFPSATARLVFAMDSTQPVAVGAALLYQSILTHSKVRESWKNEGKKLVILVVCTKNDAKGAKNYKRMKIQLRNELDKMRKVDLAIKDGSSLGGENGSLKATLNVKGKSIDLDNLGDVPASLHFIESGFGMSSGKGGLQAIHEFVLNGTLPSI
ncbi:hypothetical protein ACHAWF_003324 [Thalassiosira exigua]